MITVVQDGVLELLGGNNALLQKKGKSKSKRKSVSKSKTRIDI